MAILFPVKREMAILFFVKRDLDPPFTTLIKISFSEVSVEWNPTLIVKILSVFRSSFRNDFHYSGKDCIIGIKIHFQIEDWNLPTVDSFEITNVD